MKGLITALILLSSHTFASSYLKISAKEIDGKIILSLKNQSEKTLFCLSKIKTTDINHRTIANSRSMEFSAYEQKSLTLESNFGGLVFEGISFNCVER